MNHLAPETAAIEGYKSRQFPYTPHADYRHRLESLMSELSELAHRSLVDPWLYKYYCYVYLNPLKPGRYVYVLPSGKVVTFAFEPFYVGKGTGGRAYAHLQDAEKRNQYKHRVIRSIWKQGSTPEVKIMKSRVSEYMALAFEIDLIAGIGRKDKALGPLANLTDGGDGASGGIHVNARKLTYKGRTLPLTKWSTEVGINRSILRHRFLQGWAVERILTTPVASSRKLLVYKGKTYSIRQLADCFGLSLKALRTRLRRGWTVEQAATVSMGQRKAITYQGQSMALKDWATKTGIPEKILRKRRKRGWSPPKLFQPVRLSTSGSL